jgi:heat shock protein HslJ
MNLRQAFLGPGPTTRMAGPPEAMAQEGAFIDAMKQVRSYRLSGSSLTLGGANGPVLRFEAAAPP